MPDHSSPTVNAAPSASGARVPVERTVLEERFSTMGVGVIGTPTANLTATEQQHA